MVKHLLPSAGDRIKNTVRHLTPMVNHTSYSRHLSSRSEIRSFNGKTRTIIHVSIRPHRNQINNSDSTRQIQSEIHSLQTSWNQQSLTQIDDRSVNNERNDEILFQRNHSSSDRNSVRTKINSGVSGDNIEIMKKEDWRSNTRDLLEKSGKRKKKKYPAGLSRRCKWVIIALIAALILSAIIAGVLAATLIKYDTTTTSTISEATTMISTMSTTTMTTTTDTTAPSTTTTTTPSTTVTSDTSTTTSITPSTTVTSDTSTTTSITPSTTVTSDTSTTTSITPSTTVTSDTSTTTSITPSTTVTSDTSTTTSITPSTTVTSDTSTTTSITPSTTVTSDTSTTTSITPSTTVTSTTSTTTSITPSTSVTSTTPTTTSTTTESTTVTYTTITTSTTSTTTTVLIIANVAASESINNYGGTESLVLNCSTTLKNITIEIFVLKTYNATYNAMYGSYWGGTINPTYTTNSTYIIYSWTIISGQIITCSGGPYTFTAQFNLYGTAQVASGDIYSVSATTSAGVTNTFSGYF